VWSSGTPGSHSAAGRNQTQKGASTGPLCVAVVRGGGLRERAGLRSAGLKVRSSLALTAGAAALLTLLVSVTSLIHFAYRNPALHVAVETAATLISIVAAQLTYGRFRQSFDLGELLLTASLSVFAVSNLLFATIPELADSKPGVFGTWASVGARLLGSALFALAAVVPRRSLHHPARDARRLLAGCALALGGIALTVALAADALPQVIPPDLSPEDGRHARVVGNPTVLGTQLLVTLLFAVAAAGFTRRTERTEDELSRWLAIAATLGAFSWLNYFLFPSLYSPYFYAGDVLRLGFFLALFIGGALELRRAQRGLATAAVLEERRRVARDIHDGVTQDLAFVLQQGRRLAAQPEAPTVMRHIVIAATRALDESRHVIAALERTGGEPLIGALRATAVETAGREGGTVEMDLDDSVTVPARTQDVLLRVLREAIINAMRHGAATTIKIELRADPDVCLIVSDDGRGFDVDAATASGRLGLRSMAARIGELGGELTLQSAPGSGTRVEVRLP
jgi:signal transduction histidine kinase